MQQISNNHSESGVGKTHGDSLEIHDSTFINEARRQSILSAEADLKSDIFDFIDAIQYFGDDA